LLLINQSWHKGQAGVSALISVPALLKLLKGLNCDVILSYVNATV